MTREEFHKLTLEQRIAIRKIHSRIIIDTVRNPDREPKTPLQSLMDFIATIRHTIGCDGAVCVPYASMFLLVEKDGYTHS